MSNPFVSLNTLEETYFIAGTEFIFTFTAYDNSGSLLDLTGGSAVWRMAWMGQPDQALVTKTGSFIDSSSFQVLLEESDTQYLSTGKYIQQPIITDSEGYVFKPGQGIITIATGIY
jgi:hypothetical protein